MAISLRLGLRKDHLHPAGSGDPSATPNSVISQHRSPDSGYFTLLLTTCINNYNNIFEVYEVNFMWLLGKIYSLVLNLVSKFYIKISWNIEIHTADQNDHINLN